MAHFLKLLAVCAATGKMRTWKHSGFHVDAGPTKEGAVIDKILDHLQYKFAVLPLSARPPPPKPSPQDSDLPLDPPVWTEGD